jgi:hypothetical protein
MIAFGLLCLIGGSFVVFLALAAMRVAEAREQAILEMEDEDPFLEDDERLEDVLVPEDLEQ